jgi:site-specific recombinase XerD
MDDHLDNSSQKPLLPEIVGEGQSDLVELSEIEKEALDYAYRSRAANTVRAYRADWAHFVEWCRTHNRASLPAEPETVALYITYLANRGNRRTTTIARRLVTISEVHRSRGLETPVRHSAVRAVWDGVKRTFGFTPRGKLPTLLIDIQEMLAALPNSLLGARDRALLLIGFAGAMRRSELVRLDVTDVVRSNQGLAITIRFSKTDQEGRGRTVGIPFGENEDTCPVRAYDEWVEQASIRHGPVFRSVSRHGRVSPRRLTDKTVARVVKRSLMLASRDSTNYSGHSLRAGLATQAALCGVPERAIQDQTGHRNLMMLRRYIRAGSLFLDNAAAKIGL